MNTLAGKGISVAAPASGAWSMYTNWEQDGSRQWETFLADELPNWLAANKGLAPERARHRRRRAGRHRRDDDGDLPPRPLPLRRLAVGLPHPVRTRRRTARSPPGWRSSAASTPATCGACHSWAGGSGIDPDVHVQLLADNNTRLWVFSPSVGRCSDPAAMIGYCDHAQGSNRDVLSALPRGRRPQRPLRLPDERQPRLGLVERAAGRDVRRAGRHHQVGNSRFRAPGPPRGSRYLGGSAARGTATAVQL